MRKVVDTAGLNSSPVELTSVNADALPMYSPSSLGTLPPGYGRGAGTHRSLVVDLTDDARGNIVEVDTESGGCVGSHIKPDMRQLDSLL